MKFAKIVGSPKENSGCWIHTFTTPGPEKTATRGQLFGILRLSGLTSEEEVAAAGKELISRFHEEYYGNVMGTAFVHLKQAVAKVGMEFKAEIAALAIIGDVFYVVIAGEGRLVFSRGGKIFNLLVGAKEGLKTGSGYLKANDQFLLGSQEFFQLVAPALIQAALVASSPDEAAEALAPIIHGQAAGPANGGSNGSGAAAVIIKAEEKVVRPTIEEEVVTKKKLVILKTMAAKAASLKNNLQERLASRWSALMARARERERGPHSPKTLITVAVVLLFILGVSVILGSRQRQQLGATKQTLDLLAEAQAKKSEGQQLLSLNPEKARQLLLEAQGLSQRIETTGLKTADFEKFKTELNDLLKAAIKEYAVTGTLFFDLALIKAGAAGDDWALAGNQLMILDRNLATVYTLGTDKKQATLATGQDLKSAQKIAVGAKAAYVLTDQGVAEINLKTKSLKLKIQKDATWGEIADLDIFGDNLYLLDKGGEIWKYTAAADGFGLKQRWLKEKADLSQATAMTIDGSVWILKNDGEIIKLIQGLKAEFRVKNLTKNFAAAKALFAVPDSEFIDVLDAGNARVVVLKKTGEYDREFSWEGIKDATSLAVFEKDNRVFLLTGAKVFQVDIK